MPEEDKKLLESILAIGFFTPEEMGAVARGEVKAEDVARGWDRVKVPQHLKDPTPRKALAPDGLVEKARAYNQYLRAQLGNGRVHDYSHKFSAKNIEELSYAKKYGAVNSEFKGCSGVY